MNIPLQGQESTDERTATKPIKTTLKLHVPTNAKVFLSGNESKSTGETPRVRDHEVGCRSSWDDYTVRVELEQNGQKISKVETHLAERRRVARADDRRRRGPSCSGRFGLRDSVVKRRVPNGPPRIRRTRGDSQIVATITLARDHCPVRGFVVSRGDDGTAENAAYRRSTDTDIPRRPSAGI